ncbi:MAG: tyrosine-type recombinase/integrase [Paucibacter sp.]|nr:tyrosine-type recombinase/integrase [Roseateles sp.]
MTAQHLAGVLEAIALALRALPVDEHAAFVMPAMPPVPAPPPPPPPPDQPAPVQEAAGENVADWLSTYRTIITDRGYTGQTIKNRTTSLNFIEGSLGKRRLREVKPHEIATLLKTCTPHKAGRILGELRDVYVEAIANGLAETSPAAHVKPPRAPGLRKRLTLETWQSMLTLAQTGPQRWVPAMLLLALATGQRRADLAKMRFDDVVDGSLRVEQQKKARKLVGARVAIPLTLRLGATGLTLGEVIEYCRSIGAPGETLLRKANGSPIEMSSLSARFHEYIVAVLGADAHKLFAWPSLHEIRSLSARTYISDGMAPAVVQTLLGHKHAEMTALYLDDRGLTDGVWKIVDALPA